MRFHPRKSKLKHDTEQRGEGGTYLTLLEDHTRISDQLIFGEYTNKLFLNMYFVLEMESEARREI